MEDLLPSACRRDVERARQIFLHSPGRWHVVYHNDGDGVASASVLANAMVRMQVRFQLSPFTDVDSERMRVLMREAHGPMLVVDTGSGMLPLLATHKHPVIVLDHHRPPEGPVPANDTLTVVNPHLWGMDGMTDLSGSMLTYLFALHLDRKNTDLIGWGLSGAIADRQHVGGFQGINAALLGDAERKGEVVRGRGLTISGPTTEKAVASSVDPYLVGLSGRPAAVLTLLTELSIDGSQPPESLTEPEGQRLSGAILARLISQGTRPEFCERISEERYQLPKLRMDAATLSLLQNATARKNEPSIGIALSLGDPKALSTAWELERKWRSEVLRNLNAMEEGVEKMGAIQWFRVSEAALGGAVAGYGITFFLDPLRPAFALAPRGKFIKVSARATRWLVDNGLDLDRACREAATTVHGEGGGHRVASGATIPPGTEEKFLDIASKVVGGQLASIQGP